MSDEYETQSRLVANLLGWARRTARDPDSVAHLETHISHVLLIDDRAYKIKKPLDLGFLNFRGLNRRKHFCAEEIRLNRRLAPQVYLESIPITGTLDHPRLGIGGEPPLDYAVCMRRFRQDQLFDRLLAQGKLTPSQVAAVADQLAEFHRTAERAQPGGRGSRDDVIGPAFENFEQLKALVHEPEPRADLEILATWTRASADRLAPLFDQRQTGGFVRNCHGDVHCANIVLIDEVPMIFDCLEFSDALRFIDVINELAFLVMDFDYRQRPDLGTRALNHYLERTGDYAGCTLLPFYLIYRALVRAKIEAIRANQTEAGTDSRQQAVSARNRHLKLARAYIETARPRLVVMRGVSGSGKTTVSTLLLEQARFVRIRSDAVRKQLHGLESVARSHSTTGAGIYTPRAGEETYDRLAMLAAEVLQAGFPVVADATNLGAGQRARFRAVSQRLQIPCVIVDCWAPDSTIRRWLRDRAARGGDISEADEHVLDRQQATAEMLTGSESAMTVHLRTDRAVDGPWLLDAIARKAKIPVKVDVGGAASAKCPDR